MGVQTLVGKIGGAYGSFQKASWREYQWLSGTFSPKLEPAYRYISVVASSSQFLVEKKGILQAISKTRPRKYWILKSVQYILMQNGSTG
jgi:hypothetical protein